jgi:hypothetical protein
VSSERFRIFEPEATWEWKDTSVKESNAIREVEDDKIAERLVSIWLMEIIGSFTIIVSFETISSPSVISWITKLSDEWFELELEKKD